MTAGSAAKRTATTLIRRAIGRWSARYRAEFEALGADEHRSGDSIDARLVTFSGHRDVAQAGAMLRTFLQHAGRPRAIVVGSDGSLTPDDARLLQQVCGSVPCTVEVPEVPDLVPHEGAFRSYAASMALGKKLALLVAASNEATSPTIYADSDVLFFPGARALADDLADGDPCRFMADPTSASFDHRVDLGPGPFVNGGFLLLPSAFDWTGALAASGDLLASPTHFVDQTVAHLAIHARGGRPLPPDRYVLRTDDVWSLDDHAHRPGVVARHYVSPIRWKLWGAAFGGPRRAAVALARPLPRRR